ncbi:hypothetical protein D3C72_1507490 [compost metagenome]
MRVRTDFALVDQAFLRFVHEFDRVFDGQNMVVQALVDVVHHGRQGGRLAGTGRPRHQHEAPWAHGQLAEDARRVEVFQGQHL